VRGSWNDRDSSVIWRPLTTWFPELERVESGSVRLALWHAAYSPVLKSPTYWLIAVVTQVAAQFGCVVSVSRWARKLGFYGPVVQFILPGIAAVVAVLVITWLVRRRITHNLRHELNKRGLPTCLQCGYDLTGNVSGRCSECGTKVGV